MKPILITTFLGCVAVSLVTIPAGWAAETTDACLRDPSRWARRARAYHRRLDRSMRTLFDMIENYYEPAYRDLLHNGIGPLSVHRAAIDFRDGLLKRFSLLFRQ